MKPHRVDCLNYFAPQQCCHSDLDLRSELKGLSVRDMQLSLAISWIHPSKWTPERRVIHVHVVSGLGVWNRIVLLGLKFQNLDSTFSVHVPFNSRHVRLATLRNCTLGQCRCLKERCM